VTDNAAFAGTPYLIVKQAIGTAWCMAIAWHVYEARREAVSRSVAPNG
jgi:hypothetical protein